MCELINLSPVFVRMCIGVAFGGGCRQSGVKRLDAALGAEPAEEKQKRNRKFIPLNGSVLLLLALVLTRLLS